MIIPHNKLQLFDYEEICNHMFSHVLIFSAIIMGVNLIEDFFDKPIVWMMDLGIILILAVFYTLNIKGYALAAKILYALLMNIIMFYFAAATHSRNSVGVNMLPFTATIMLIMGRKNILYSVALSFLSLFLFIYLEINEYHISWIPAIGNPTRESVSVIINISSAFILLIYSLYTLITIIGKYEVKLKEKNQSLTDTNNELDRLVYTVSHDVRSPLTSIRGVAQLGQNSHEVKEKNQHFVTIDKIAHGADEFIHQVIEYSRNATLAERKEKLDLEKLIEDQFDTLQYVDVSGKIRFDFDIRVKEPIYLDKIRLQIILNNLLSNAMYYYDVQKKTPWIKVSAFMDDNQLLLSIADNGVGISRYHINNVFYMYYRASERSSGSGLGLYIVNEMVKKMNGHIQVQSVEGEGTEFKIMLPV